MKTSFHCAPVVSALDCFHFRNLFYVMASVDEVELPPLPRRQWSKNRMIQDLDAGTIALFALRDRSVHGSDLRTDDGDHFFRGHALGRDRIGGFPPLGKVAELRDRGGGNSLLERRRTGQRLPGFETALESFLRSRVSQVEVLKHFCCTPLPFHFALQLLAAHVAGGGSYCLLQTSQIRIHGPSDCSL